MNKEQYAQERYIQYHLRPIRSKNELVSHGHSGARIKVLGSRKRNIFVFVSTRTIFLSLSLALVLVLACHVVVE